MSSRDAVFQFMAKLAPTIADLMDNQDFMTAVGYLVQQTDGFPVIKETQYDPSTGEVLIITQLKTKPNTDVEKYAQIADSLAQFILDFLVTLISKSSGEQT